MFKTQTSSYVEIKTVTWSKDSHGLFDYESKDVNFAKQKVNSSAKIYKQGNHIITKSTKEAELIEPSNEKEKTHLFSVVPEKGKEDKFCIKIDESPVPEGDKETHTFLVVRSLKTEEGAQKGYKLELGDVIRLGRIEYRLIEYQDEDMRLFSLLNEQTSVSCPFTLTIKDCNADYSASKQCRICLMDEDDTPEPLVNPCNCKGTSAYVHLKCIQDWISSKVKRKVNPNTICSYWKKLNCEVCKLSLPDLVDIEGERKEIIPISRPEGPYILLERVFYDKSKSNSENSKTLILLNLSTSSHQIKLGRGHECDLREADISVSRLHAFIKYQDGNFVIFDNNSKFGTLVLLRKHYDIGKKKIAFQIGRTVVTFSLKQSSVNCVPILKHPLLLEKLSQWYSPKEDPNCPLKTSTGSPLAKNELNLNSSFLD